MPFYQTDTQGRHPSYIAGEPEGLSFFSKTLFLKFPRGKAKTLGEAAGEVAGRIEPSFEKYLGDRLTWIFCNRIMRFQKPEFL